MSAPVRDALLDLVRRAARGDLTGHGILAPLDDLHRYSPAAAHEFRQAAVLALLTPTMVPGSIGDAPVGNDTPVGNDASAGNDPAHRTGADLFLVQRSPLLRNHPGQIALPGGGLEPADSGPEAAAVRETEEETGIPPNRIEVLGALPPVPLPISSFMVTPVLGWAPKVPPVRRVEQTEVLHTLRVPIDSLLRSESRATVVHGEHNSPGFRTESGWIWGFTGIVLDRLFTELGWTLPWDSSARYTMTWDEAHGSHLPSPD